MKLCKNPDCRKEFEPILNGSGIALSNYCRECDYQRKLDRRIEQMGKRMVREEQRLKSPKNATKSVVKEDLTTERKSRRVDYSKMDHEHLLSTAQKWFNAFIRKRDELPNRTFFCPTCGRYKSIQDSDYQACHCFPAGHCAALRFNELNVYGGCLQCNYFKHGTNYRYNDWVRRKIGEVEYAKLEILSHTSAKFDRFELIQIIKTYKEKIKQYEK